MSTYELGTVAVATVRGVPNVRVVRAEANAADAWFTAIEVRGFYDHNLRQVTDVRPLVVLDLEDPASLLATLRDSLSHMLKGGPNHGRLTGLIAEIEQQIRPPKPAEPTGLGAVVEDANGLFWVLYTHHENTAPWTEGSTSVEWDDVPAVRVLSEGVRNV